MGTSAIYEYAATAIGPRSSGASFDVTKIAVGPSAPPIIPIAPACCAVKPKNIAPVKVMNIPICAAAPRIKLFVFALRGPTAVVAPTPKNISCAHIPTFLA